MSDKESLIKSKKRVRDFGEVFTPKKIVNDMLDLIPEDVFKKTDSKFLEPACGTININLKNAQIMV